MRTQVLFASAALTVLEELKSRLASERAEIEFNEMENPNWPVSERQAVAEEIVDMLEGAIETLEMLLEDDKGNAQNG